MKVAGERVVEEYIDRLERSMADLPAARRDEIVSGIVDHIDEALDRLEADPTEADVRNVLERLGDPEDIAAEARERLNIRPPTVRWTDTAAIVLLLIGGFLWGIGWIVGVVFLWMSDVWSVRDKILGTLIIPGGLSLPILFSLFAVGWAPSTDSSAIAVLGIVVFVALLVAPVVVAVFLGRKIRRARITSGGQSGVA